MKDRWIDREPEMRIGDREMEMDSQRDGETQRDTEGRDGDIER